MGAYGVGTLPFALSFRFGSSHKLVVYPQRSLAIEAGEEGTSSNAVQALTLGTTSRAIQSINSIGTAVLSLN